MLTPLRLLAAGLGLAMGPAALAAQSDTLWRHSDAADVRFTRVDPAGHLLVVTDQAVTALHPDSGSVVWKYPVAGQVRLLGVDPLGHLLVGYAGVVAALDPLKGDIIWRRTDLPDLEHATFRTRAEDSTALVRTRNGIAALNLATGVTRWDSTALPPSTIVRDLFRFANHNLLLLVARTPKSEASLLALTLDSARLLWRDDSLFTANPKFERPGDVEYFKEFQYPLLLADTSLLLYVSRDGPISLDARTGRVRWRATELGGQDVPGVDQDYPELQLRDSLILVPAGKQLVALDTGTGKVRWRTTGEFRDKVSWLYSKPTPIVAGGVAREKPFLQAVDPASGAAVWPSQIELKQPAYAYYLRDTLYVASDGHFMAVPLATGVSRSLTELGFEGGDEALGMDTVEGGGFVLWNRQNIMRVGLDGHVAYRKYYKAPGASFLKKLASTVALVGLSVASIALTPPGGFAPIATSNPVLSARYAQAKAAQNHYYVFTESPPPDSASRKGYSLVLVDRRDGRELGRMWFNEKTPHYAIDNATATVYVRQGDHDIVARRFKP